MSRVTKHGRHNTRIYRVWMSMLDRCRRKNHPAWSAYGGRGITVCERWLTFENFVADMGERPSRMELDRINNDGNYGPGNCKWSTIKQQARNRRSNTFITLNGETKCIAEWAQQMGVRPGLIGQRLSYGWTVEEAILKPAVPPRFRRNRSLIPHSNTQTA